MRIRDIRIDSFGQLKDRRFRLGPGLNVFYGPNESGKTTTMEFIRSTLVPTRTRLYPARAKSDSGTITVEDQSGIAEISYGSTEGIPEILRDMDPELYRNIFAMNQKGLDDYDSVSNNDIRSRFLTIPGGESMPAVIEGLEDETKQIVGLTARSPSALNGIQAKEDEILNKIAEMRSGAESYSQLKDRSAELRTELDSIADANRVKLEDNELYSKVCSQRPNFQSLEELRAKREAAAKEAIVTEEEVAEHDRLVSERDGRKSAFEAVESSLKDLSAKLPVDESKARRYLPEIEGMLLRRRESVTAPQPVPEPKKGFPVIALALVLIGSMALAIPFLDITTRVIITGVFVLLGFLAFAVWKKRPAASPVQAPLVTDTYERDLIALMGSLGLLHTTVNQDLNVLNSLKNTLASIDMLSMRASNLRIQYMQADNDYVTFVSRFRGEQGYQEAVSRSGQIGNLDSAIAALTDNIREAGFDPDQPLPDVEYTEVDSSRQDEINTELGRLEQQMKGILDTEDLDALIDTSYTVASEKGKLLREAAVLLISEEIVQKACSDLYSDVHPDVVTTADRYLSMMTSGVYHLDTDPRSTDIAIISEQGRKTQKQWSTGLRAQVLLSLKLAIAKEMGGGDIPMILDDVLLPFDSVRKEGACSALSQVSGEMQILLFTCDDSVKRICEGIDGANIISLS